MKEILNRIAETAVREPTPIPPAKPTPQRLTFKSACLRAFLFGAVPVIVLVLGEVFGIIRAIFGSIRDNEYLVLFYGVWGFAVGWHHKSFFRMLVGLNAGALMGFVVVNTLESPTDFWEFLTLFCFSFGILVSLISFERTEPANSIVRSFLSGTCAHLLLAVYVRVVLWTSFTFAQDFEPWILLLTLIMASAAFLSLSVVFYFLIPIPPPLITLRHNHLEGSGDE